MSDNALPNFRGIYERYKALGNGPRAQIRRVAYPNDLMEIPGFYHLFQNYLVDTESQVEPWMLRLAFLLPTCGQVTSVDADTRKPKSKKKQRKAGFAEALAEAGMRDARVIQMFRSTAPHDLIALRRMAQQVEPNVDWAEFGKTLYDWRPETKRRLMEDFFLAQTRETTPLNAITETGDIP